MKRYVVFSYAPPTRRQIEVAEQDGYGRPSDRQYREGLFDDRAEADRVAWQAVTVKGRAVGQVLSGGRCVYWVDQDEIDHGLVAPQGV